MKYLMLCGFFVLISWHAVSKEAYEKTFLVLFHPSELQKIETSPAYIGSHFFEEYSTRSYSGNSEAALLITVPYGEMTECQLGETLVQIDPATWVPLHEIAFRIIDLNRSRSSYAAILNGPQDFANKTKTARLRLKR